MIARLMGLLIVNANTVVFLVGLLVLSLSLAAWSRPMAGTVLGLALMTVGVWPVLATRKQ